MLRDELVQEARNEDSAKYSAWVGLVYPLLISSTMVLFTVKMHDLIKVLEIMVQSKLGMSKLLFGLWVLYQYRVNLWYARNLDD